MAKKTRKQSDYSMDCNVRGTFLTRAEVAKAVKEQLPTIITDMEAEVRSHLEEDGHEVIFEGNVAGGDHVEVTMINVQKDG